MAKRHTTIRLSEETDQQLAMLVSWWGTGVTKAEIIATAIDRLYQEKARERKVKQE